MGAFPLPGTIAPIPQVVIPVVQINQQELAKLSRDL